ncbi:MBL fold metallo-hydrolase [Clostridium sp. chh4-2]|uniref:MBL fold metallo-hydrolase n=1 Tax=Clostridium sp. chh4-2 TaxID=2067550 RepID=UPI000CCDDDF8|nr:MBL fold metallo-hydrolase [Clostridium sp. chh4-2]PNV62724.1 MBL fold metallo-hydrolase [Clostridium sp. chh4-2]
MGNVSGIYKVWENDWFTVEQIDSDTFAVSEYKHWEETHSYLLLGNDRALMIDSGLGISDISRVVRSITRLPVLLAATHVHWDHIGGHKFFHNIAVHEKEEKWLSVEFPIPLEVVKKNLVQKECEFPADFDIDQYRIYRGKPDQILHDGDRIDLGGREIEVIHTPGHSPGHICFFDRKKQFLYSGDLIYSGCLDAFYPTTDPYEFMQSVKKVEGYPIERILPGHHKLDISVRMVTEVGEAFGYLYERGVLRQGEGVFEFLGFQIHL